MVVLQSSGTLCAISDGILLCGYISMGGHTILEAEMANMAVTDALARPPINFIHFVIAFAC